MTIKQVIKSLFVCAGSLLTACSTPPSANASQAAPAILTESSAKHSAIISYAMSTALNGKEVTLISSAFTTSHEHVIQKRVFNDISQGSVDGLILGIPKVDRFILYKQGKSCYLIHEKTAKKYPLTGVSCQKI